MLDLRAQPVLQRQRQVRAGHAPVQQDVLENVTGVRGALALQHERQHPQATAGEVGIAP